MKCSFLKLISLSTLTILFSLPLFADEEKSAGKSFQSLCSDAWMKKIGDVKDKVDYKNFGEKYCACAAKQPLNNESAVKEAVHLCMSQTILHDAMDSLEEAGLSKAKDSDIKDSCQDRWTLIYPKQTEEQKKITNAYCDCATPKLMEIVKGADKMTDNEYNEGINKVAADCSGNALAAKPAAKKE